MKTRQPMVRHSMARHAQGAGARRGGAAPRSASQRGASPRGSVWLLLPMSLAVFAFSGLLYYQYSTGGTGAAHSWLQGILIWLYGLLGFAPALTLCLLLVCWTTIWFLTGEIRQPLGRIWRLLAFTLALAVLSNLRQEPGAPIPPGAGALGVHLALGLRAAFGYTVSTLLMVVVTVPALLLATDFLFYRYFEGGQHGGDASGAPAPTAATSATGTQLPEEGVEQEATEVFMSLGAALGAQEIAPRADRHGAEEAAGDPAGTDGDGLGAAGPRTAEFSVEDLVEAVTAADGDPAETAGGEPAPVEPGDADPDDHDPELREPVARVQDGKADAEPEAEPPAPEPDVLDLDDLELDLDEEGLTQLAQAALDEGDVAPAEATVGPDGEPDAGAAETAAEAAASGRAGSGDAESGEDAPPESSLAGVGPAEMKALTPDRQDTEPREPDGLVPEETDTAGEEPPGIGDAAPSGADGDDAAPAMPAPDELPFGGLLETETHGDPAVASGKLGDPVPDQSAENVDWSAEEPSEEADDDGEAVVIELSEEPVASEGSSAQAPLSSDAAPAGDELQARDDAHGSDADPAVPQAAAGHSEPADTNDATEPVFEIPRPEPTASQGDPLVGEAEELVRQARRASVNLLHRRLGVDRQTARELLVALRDRGVIHLEEGAQQGELV